MSSAEFHFREYHCIFIRTDSFQTHYLLTSRCLHLIWLLALTRKTEAKHPEAGKSANQGRAISRLYDGLPVNGDVDPRYRSNCPCDSRPCNGPLIGKACMPERLSRDEKRSFSRTARHVPFFCAGLDGSHYVGEK